MTRKRFGEMSGNWHVDVFVNGEWIEITEVGDEDQADGIIETLTAWLMESVADVSED